MDIQKLNTILVEIENALLRRKQEEYDFIFETYELAGGAVSTSAATGAEPGGEAYAGYAIGREGTMHHDSGKTATPVDRMKKAYNDAMIGGPGKGLPPQTTDGQAAAAKRYAEKGREDTGDVDHSAYGA